MAYIAWFVYSFTIVQLIIALVNLIFSSKLRKYDYNGESLVSILIPARNEEKNIGHILNDILYQNYSLIEVIVFDDNSSDTTSDIVNGFAAMDKRIRLVKSVNLPDGWLGKNHACHSLSEEARGDYFLFLDADVRIKDNLVYNAISYAEHYRLSLISIFPKQIIFTPGEKMTVPNMNYILLSLLPLILVRKSGMPSLSAANGQFMFFRSDIYKSLRPHEVMKNNRVEDIEIARYYKKKKQNIACLTGDDSIKCRMYDGFKEAVNGFSKNVTTFFGNSILLAFPFKYFVVYFLLYLFTRITISIISGQHIAGNIKYLIPQQISLGMFIFKSFKNTITGSVTWKGRDLK
jgi:cellulose synthase/poly-beta-1,6-N-acetylglucosamine synthase-like glycosyltransferase